MDRLDRCPGTDGTVAVYPEQASTGDRQQRPEALASTDGCVPHGFEEDVAAVVARKKKPVEEIVRLLERGEAPLDQSIELYQEGDRLKRHCEARLKDAQARIEQIAFGSDGKPAGVTPFDAG